MIFRSRASNPHTERAQGLVEFALVLPILLLIMFGIIEIGRLLVIYSSVGTASREGARYASAVGDSAVGVPYYQDCAGIRGAAKRMGILVGMQDSDIDITYDEGPDAAAVTGWNACPPPEGPAQAAGKYIDLGDRVEVEVRALYRPLMPLVNIPGFWITSRTARTIIRDVSIEAPISYP